MSRTQAGFTLVELVVVVALVALLSSVVLFNGGGSRDRHIVEGAYSVLDLSLSQAVLLGRAQASDDETQASTHWVFNSANNTIAIYQDNPAGTGGIYDVADDVRETYAMNPTVEVLACDGPDAGCVITDNLLTLSWSPSDPQAIVREGGGELAALYVKLMVGNQTIDVGINQLGVISKE